MQKEDITLLSPRNTNLDDFIFTQRHKEHEGNIFTIESFGSLKAATVGKSLLVLCAFVALCEEKRTCEFINFRHRAANGIA